MKNENNTAYIDGANLYNGMRFLDIDLDYKRLYIWLKDKFKIKKAYIYLGNIPKNHRLYSYLQECGYIIVFKEVVYDNSGKAKGNCDADLVLQATRYYYENKFDNMILISSDGDYASLVYFLKVNNKILGIISPSNKDKCSVLLKRTDVKIYYLTDQKNLLQKEKAPDRDKTL